MILRINRLLKGIAILLIVFFIVVFATNLYYKVSYPLYYKKLINLYAKKYNIDPYLIAAIINVESNFNKNALSPKDARGLMQIAPTTGEWAAETLDINGFNLELLFEPEINIRIGTWYLDLLTKEFGNNIQLILAAYNGGSGNVSKWLKNEEYSEDGKYLKKIPFQETEQYIERVLKNYQIYKTLYKGEFNGNAGDMEPYFLQLFHNFRKIVKSFIAIIR